MDTDGANVGTEAEERGQEYAIAACLEKSFSLDVPIFSVIIGEGGSGGAIALASANKIFMLEHSIYSVISPEGCASILWRSPSRFPSHDSYRRRTTSPGTPEYFYKC